MATTAHNNDEIFNADDKNIAGKVSSSGGSSEQDVQYGTATIANTNGDFVDRTISVRDWSSRTFEDIPGQLKHYVVSLFPIATWIYRYNFTWFIGDVSSKDSSPPCGGFRRRNNNYNGGGRRRDAEELLWSCGHTTAASCEDPPL